MNTRKIHARGLLVTYKSVSTSPDLHDSSEFAQANEATKKSDSKKSVSTSKNKVAEAGRFISKRSAGRLKDRLAVILHCFKKPKFFTLTIPRCKNTVGRWLDSNYTSQDGTEISESFEHDKYYVAKFKKLMDSLSFSNSKRVREINYLYVLERQTKNNRNALHFHVIIDHYISVIHIRKRWNDLLSEYHYESRNCVDVVRIKGFGLRDYLSKSALGRYLSKQSKERCPPVFSRPWACSHKISSLASPVVEHNQGDFPIPATYFWHNDFAGIYLCNEKNASKFVFEKNSL